MTLLVTKADEATGRYRDGMTTLEQYSMTHGIPKVGCMLRVALCMCGPAPAVPGCVLELVGAAPARLRAPQDLQDAMKGHLRLHFSAQEASDEQVLATYPTAIRWARSSRVSAVVAAHSTYTLS